MRSRAILLPRRVRSASGNRSKYASICGLISTMSTETPKRSATARASASLSALLVRYGMVTARTCSAPRLRAARATTSEESTPPDAPTTTWSKPALRTSSRMNPVSSVSTTPVSIARLLSADSLVLGVVDIVPFVTQHRGGDARPAQCGLLESVVQDRLLRARGLGEQGAIGTDDARAAPEPDAVLVAHAVAVHDVRGVQ